MAESDPFRHIRELARSIVPGTTATDTLSLEPAESPLAIPRRRGRRPERDDTTRRIAAALKRARLRKGTTQRDLGALIGVPQSHISKI
ncbi:MAG: helix-turn-helix domain-containing protein, partial [Gammaproteobacteria bacterium]